MTEQSISLERLEETINVFGSFDENIRIIERRDGGLGGEPGLHAEGERRERGKRDVRRQGHRDPDVPLLPGGGHQRAERALYHPAGPQRQRGARSASWRGTCCASPPRGKPIKAKTLGQKKYVEAIKKNVVTLGIGPAGTGKTYLAVAAAVAAFRAKEVNRIILTRPAVEAGERLGFLPGDLQSKVDPYLRPLYDALFDMLGAETYRSIWSGGTSRWPPWPICGAAPWTTASSSWTRPRTPPGSR